MISDRDPRFTSQFGKALTEKLGIQRNLSMAFHPQTNGLLERKNQWIEQYLRLVTSNDPKGWTHWLVLATTVHNNQVNTTTRLSPNQILFGYNPTLNSDKVLQTHNTLVESQIQTMTKNRADAIRALNKIANQKGPPPSEGQTYPKTPRPVQNHPRDIPGSLPIGITPKLENPQRVSHFPPDPLS